MPKMTNALAQEAANAWHGQAGGRLTPQLTENELAGLVNEAAARTEENLLKELKAARLAIQKMKAEFNEFDDGYAIGKAALSRANKAVKVYRKPVALPVTTGS